MTLKIFESVASLARPHGRNEEEISGREVSNDHGNTDPVFAAFPRKEYDGKPLRAELINAGFAPSTFRQQ